jgi:dTDP-glucose 4,6-dehydratase
MTIFVTGGAGFIGSNFVRHMLNKYPDINIVNYDLLTYAGNLDNLQEYESDPRYRFIKGDITILEEVKEAMKGCDYVVHFAAESHVDRSIEGPAIFVKTNVLGTQVLLDAAKELGIKKFHHVSTDEVFGSLNLGENTFFSENTPYNPHSPYSASKASSDHLVRAYGDTFGLSFLITNCSNNYGPYQFPEKIIPLFITNALEGKNLPIYGDGKCVRDYLHVADHCRAIDLVLQKGEIGETYCIGGGAEKNGLEIAEGILNILKKPKDLMEFVKDRPGHDRRYAIDASKIKNGLGWEPEHTFEEWLEKTVRWYEENQSWWKRVKSGEYRAIES